MTYDVIGVSVDRAYVDIAADVKDRSEACRVAAEFSARPMWSSVYMKDRARGGLITDTYVDGKNTRTGQPSRHG